MTNRQLYMEKRKENHAPKEFLAAFEDNTAIVKVTDKNSIKLIDSSEKVWCEIVCDDDNICTLKLFNQNIPSDYRGQNNTDIFTQTISCTNPHEALACQGALAALVFNGYSESNWYVGGLDIGDIIGVFSDKMSFCEMSIDTDKLDSYSETISKLNARKAFIYFRVNRANKDTLNEYVLNTVLHPNALVEKDVELWIQYSMDNTIPLGSLVVDLWYC